MIPFYTELANRFHDLHADVLKDLETLPNEALDWTPGPDTNSVSVVIVHLTGAERFLIGDVILQDPSNRNRDAEFQVRGMTMEELVRRLNTTDTYIRAALEKLDLPDLEATRLHPRHGSQVSVSWALLHALEHAATHLGHIQLTVQMWKQQHAGEG
jgi:uncharacterized damage-inducible protein DinB